MLWASTLMVARNGIRCDYMSAAKSDLNTRIIYYVTAVHKQRYYFIVSGIERSKTNSLNRNSLYGEMKSVGNKKW